MVRPSKLKNIILKAFEISIKAFPFLVVFTYGLVLIETYTYIGALKKYLFVDSRFLLFLTVTIAFFIVVGATKKQISNQFITTTFVLNTLLSPLVIFLYYYFLMAEAIHFPNFVFSTYHIQPANMVNIVYLNLSLLGCYWLAKNQSVRKLIVAFANRKSEIQESGAFTNSRDQIKKSQYIELATFSLLILLMSNYLLVNITSTFAKISTDLVFIVNNPRLNYDQKMEKAWGKMYYYFLYVNKTIPGDAVIGLPPAQHRWLRTGNTVLMRYFLFPHKLVNLKETWKEETLRDLPVDKYDYLLMIPGDWNDGSVPEGWPKQAVLADYVEYYDPKTNTSEKVYTNFDPSLEINQKSWGIIKIRKQ